MNSFPLGYLSIKPYLYEFAFNHLYSLVWSKLSSVLLRSTAKPNWCSECPGFAEYINAWSIPCLLTELLNKPLWVLSVLYPDITSKIICEKLENSDIINISDAKILSKYDNTCFVFMSPNDISKLEDDLKELLKNN